MSALDRDPATRVVVTGMGVATVLGEDPDTLADALLAGRSGIGRWRDVDPRVLSRIGGDLSEFSLDRSLERVGAPAALRDDARALYRASPPVSRLVAWVVSRAAAQAGLDTVDPERVGHLLGAHNCNERFVIEQARELEIEPEFIDPLYGVVAFDTDPLAAANELLGVRGPAWTVGGACASGNVALIQAMDLLRSGRADAVITSAAAMTASPLALQGWAILDALAIQNFQEDPTQASRPFDRRREGFVPSEGAGAVVLETLAHARRRGAPIFAELRGGAVTSAASRGTRTDVDAQRRALRLGLRDAGINASDVDYVNAHGTSTPIGDRNEIVALRDVLGARAGEIPINATKSMMGHALQGASLIELVVTVEQLRRGWVHPTRNLDEVDPELVGHDFVPGSARPHRIRNALSNAFGFGGINAVVVVGSAP